MFPDRHLEFVGQTVEARKHSDVGARSVFTDLIRAFVGLHKKYELPARREAHRLGHNILSVEASDAPYRDRLKFGFAWRALVECMLEEQELKPHPWRTNLMTLLLDHLIDMGIAVPVLRLREGILFRAYRYGEDVPFGDQECALSYEAANGYLQGSARRVFQELHLKNFWLAYYESAWPKSSSLCFTDYQVVTG